MTTPPGRQFSRERLRRLLEACSKAGNVAATELVAGALEREAPPTFIDVLAFEKLERRYLGEAR